MGARNVAATTTGGERTKVSMAFSATADGRKLPILIILPRKKPLKAFEPPENVVILYKKKSKTFDSQVMKDTFLNKIIKPYMSHHNKSKLLLHLDNSPVHKRKDLLQEFKFSNVSVSFFPPRMTSLLNLPMLAGSGQLNLNTMPSGKTGILMTRSPTQRPKI